jgi:hypothetical protein
MDTASHFGVQSTKMLGLVALLIVLVCVLVKYASAQST